MTLEHAGGHRLDGVAVAHVAELDLGVDLVGECAQPVLAPRDEDALPPLPREQAGGRLADPGRGARDHRDPVAGGRLVRRRARARAQPFA